MRSLVRAQPLGRALRVSAWTLESGAPPLGSPLRAKRVHLTTAGLRASGGGFAEAQREGRPSDGVQAHEACAPQETI
jgi:hypothetical protein